jgi:calcineurin-like phosphoesterase
MVMAVDFHSTQQDVFYTMPSDYGVLPAKLVETWLDTLKGNTASSFVVRNKPGSSPGRGIFKQYFADTFKVHAITYEMGDNTQRKMISHVANQAADTLMQTLLATEAKAFHPQQQKP